MPRLEKQALQKLGIEPETLAERLQRIARELGHTETDAESTYLTILSEFIRPSGKVMVNCKCICGKLCTLPRNLVKRQVIRSCGCKSRPNALDATNKKKARPAKLYAGLLNHEGEIKGFLLVGELVAKYTTIWRCTCACGTELQVLSNRLGRNPKKTCGADRCVKLLKIGYSRDEAIELLKPVRKASVSGAVPLDDIQRDAIKRRFLKRQEDDHKKYLARKARKLAKARAE